MFQNDNILMNKLFEIMKNINCVTLLNFFETMIFY